MLHSNELIFDPKAITELCNPAGAVQVVASKQRQGPSAPPSSRQQQPGDQATVLSTHFTAPRQQSIQVPLYFSLRCLPGGHSAVKWKSICTNGNAGWKQQVAIRVQCVVFITVTTIIIIITTERTSNIFEQRTVRSLMILGEGVNNDYSVFTSSS